MRKEKRIDIDKIVKQNPNVDVGQLNRNINMLNDLKKAGVKVGPNYTLESPFSRSKPQEEK